MNENLIEALNAYTVALEQKTAALEQRVAQLEGLLAANTACDQQTATRLEQLQAQVAEQEERIAKLEATPAPQPTTAENDEPEIEVELITEDEVEESEVVAEETPIVEETPTKEVVEQAPLAEEEQPTEVVTKSEEPKEEATTATAEESSVSRPTENIKTEPLKIEEQPRTNGLYGKGVRDIRMAISIGDRFLFQRELFDKNPELLQKTLTEVNGLNTFEEAMAYIDSHFSWDKELPAYELFINALHRRFG